MVSIAQRAQSRGEEIANSISHGMGAIGAIAVAPVMIIKSVPAGAPAVVGVSIFVATTILLYLSSTLYHALSLTRAKKLFQLFDHSAIFLLIAGTYTPFTLGILRGAWGWTLFGIVWGLAIFGILVKSIAGAHPGKLSTMLYLAMGWLAVVAIEPLWTNLPALGLFWLLGGGLMYSAGVIFFVYDARLRYGHFVWHLFVMFGTACHVVAVMMYAV